MALFLLGLILLFSLAGMGFAEKLGIPAFVLFMLAGMGLATVTAPLVNFEGGEVFGSLGLLFVLFYEGFRINMKLAKSVVPAAISLSTIGVVITGTLVGLFVHFVLGWSLVGGLLLGAVVSSTDFLGVAAVLHSNQLFLKHRTIPLLALESGTNDPIAYTLVMVMISLLLGRPVNIPLLLVQQIGVSVGIGFLVSFIMRVFVERGPFHGEGSLTVFLFALAIFTFGLTEELHGNGYLAVFLLGLRIGNMNFVEKRDLVFFFDGLSKLVEIGLFFLIGNLTTLDNLLSQLPTALIIVLFSTLLARPIAVFLSLAPFRITRGQKFVLSFGGLRGAAAIAFAIIVVNSGVPRSQDLFSIVFAVCFLSNLLQGFILPFVCKKFNLIDPTSTSLKNFNFYQTQSGLGFLTMVVEEGSELDGVRLRDITNPFQLLIVKVLRRGKVLVPQQVDVLHPEDRVVLAGEEYFDTTGQHLVEFELPPGHRWIGKTIPELHLSDTAVIIAIQRKDGHTTVPSKRTVCRTGDKIIMMNTGDLYRSSVGSLRFLSSNEDDTMLDWAAFYEREEETRLAAQEEKEG